MLNSKSTQQRLYYNLYNPLEDFICDICLVDITQYARVIDGDQDYCIFCFAKMDKWPQKYHLANKLDFVLMDEEWSSRMELLLLEGLLRYGYGNWKQIAELVGHNLTEEEVEVHYHYYYIDNKVNFLPDNQSITRRKICYKKKIRDIEDYDSSCEGEYSDSKQEIQPYSIQGYLPLRKDFQIEYNNQAELLLAEMVWNEDDSAEDKQIKCKIFDIYNMKIDIRNKVKEFVIGRNMLDLKYHNELDRVRTKEEKQFRNMMKVFARFNTHEEHERFNENLMKQKNLREQIHLLTKYKQMGIKTFKKAKEYQEKKKKQEEIQQRKYRQNYIKYGFLYQQKQFRNLDDEQLKQYRMLSITQRVLCKRIKVSFLEYVVIKQTLIRQYHQEGALCRQRIHQIFKVEKQKINQIFELLVQIKCIQSV